VLAKWLGASPQSTSALDEWERTKREVDYIVERERTQVDATIRQVNAYKTLVPLGRKERGN